MAWFNTSFHTIDVVSHSRFGLNYSTHLLITSLLLMPRYFVLHTAPNLSCAKASKLPPIRLLNTLSNYKRL